MSNKVEQSMDLGTQCVKCTPAMDQHQNIYKKCKWIFKSKKKKNVPEHNIEVLHKIALQW